MQNPDSMSSGALANGGDHDEDNELAEFSGQTYEDRNGQHHPIAEFLYQLTKMLTDDNSEIIEWADGRIKVHHPERLEGEVLHKYFRHSKFASFQRQLNYFGFRKIAGKGKMSPCSYVNEAATSDIRSLLLIKRKTNGTAARKAALQQRAAALVSSAGLNPALASMNFAALAGDHQNAMAMLNGQALSNAMALLSENALRASVGQIPMQQSSNSLASQQLASSQLTNQQLNLLALQQQHQRLQKQLQDQQQQQQQQQFQMSQLGADQLLQNKLMGLQSLQQQQEENSNQNIASSSTPSLEQLQAHLAALSQQQQQQQQMQQNNALNQNLLNRNLASLPAAFLAAGNNRSLGDGNGSLSLNSANPASAALNRATAALNAQQSGGNSMPATAAMDAASATAQMNNNLFESAANLKSLLNEHQQNEQVQQAVNSMGGNQQSIFNRLPSSTGLFPENASTMSFGNLLGSSNRLNSLLSLNSFLGSREASLADFAAAMPANVRDQLAGGVSQVRDASKFRANT